MEKVKLLILTVTLAVVTTAESPLYELLGKESNETYESVEFTGYAKFDPRDYETEAKKTVSTFTSEKINLIGA
jgi:hypothetical protein